MEIYLFSYGNEFGLGMENSIVIYHEIGSLTNDDPANRPVIPKVSRKLEEHSKVRKSALLTHKEDIVTPFACLSLDVDPHQLSLCSVLSPG